MKKFVTLIILFAIAYLGVIAAIRFSWLHFVPTHLERNFIKEGTHTVVLGPSNGTFSWDDAIIPHSSNQCAIGSSLGSCYNTLRHVTEYNSVKVDTVVLCASLSAFAYYHDGISLYLLQKENEELRNVLNYQTFYGHYKDKKEYWSLALTSSPFTYFKGEISHGFEPLHRDKLNHPKLYDALNEVIDLAGGEDKLTEQFYREHCKYQTANFKQIVSYCKDHHQTLIILSPPVFKIPDIVDDRGYRQFLKAELGDSVLVADYSRFEFPDTTYYADLEHVNYKGAKFFSEHIAKNGLKTEYLIDYSK